MTAEDLTGTEITLRRPCARCASSTGVIKTKRGQDVAYCGECGAYAGYNVPRAESGRNVRSLRTRPEIPVSQRARILLRDGRACIICHRQDINLEIGHLVSVHDGEQAGLSEQLIYSDENLAAMCQACNSGISKASLPLRLLVPVLVLRAGDAPGAVAAA